MDNDALTTLFNNVIDKMETYTLTQTKPDDLTLQRMKKDVKKVGKINPSLAAMALGMIASVEGDLEECLKQHKLSLLLGDDPHLTINYSVSMRTLGYNAESYRLMDIGMNLIMPNLSLGIGSFIAIAFHAGHYDKVIFCQELFKKQTVTAIPPEIQQFIDDVNTIVMTTGLPLSVYPDIAAILETIRLENHPGLSIATLEKTDEALVYWAETIADSETVTVMNTQLAAELALLDDVNLDNYHIAFRKLNKHEGSTCH